MTQKLLWRTLQDKGIKAELLRAICVEEPTSVLIDFAQREFGKTENSMVPPVVDPRSRGGTSAEHGDLVM